MYQDQLGVLIVHHLHGDVGDSQRAHGGHAVGAIQHHAALLAADGGDDRRVLQHPVGLQTPHQRLAALRVMLLMQQQLGRRHHTQVGHFGLALMSGHTNSLGRCKALVSGPVHGES